MREERPGLAQQSLACKVFFYSASVWSRSSDKVTSEADEVVAKLRVPLEACDFREATSSHFLVPRLQEYVSVGL